MSPGQQSPPVDNQQPESTFQFVTPTEFVELPSKGVFYPEGHPLHNKDTIEIRHMTAKDEDILTSRALLQKGIAIDRLLQNIIVDKSIKIPDLLVGDKNALIIAARITGYGEIYEVNVNCPACSTSVEAAFDLNDCGVQSHDAYKEQDVELTPDGTFNVHLDKLNLDVEVRLLTSRDELYLMQLSEKRKKKKLPETPLTDQLRRIIVSVNGNSDSDYVNSFIEFVPASSSRKLRSIYQKIVPNVDMTQNFICSSCGHDGEVSVPFGANFFWPR